MKKVFLVLAVMALVTVASCKHVDAPSTLTTTDSTAVAVDSVQVDSTTVDTTATK